jgi:hypothetical protein
MREQVLVLKVHFVHIPASQENFWMVNHGAGTEKEEAGAERSRHK